MNTLGGCCRFARRLFVVVAAAAVSAPAAFAQLDEGKVDSYRFLPRVSVMHQTGGIAGVDQRFHVRGTFDFRIAPSPLAVFPPLYNAFFESVDAWGSHPMLAFVLDVEETFNLEELVGGQRLDRPRRPNLFHFEGEREDGSTVDLHVLKLGPWLYMRGDTDPPPGSADFFEHSIRALARKTPAGDFNGDGEVDRADLAEWAKRPGRTGDGFLEWQRGLGEPPSFDELDAELNAALAASVSAVPEPSTGLLAMLGGAFLAMARRRLIA
jgi:hypothetical protein